MKNDEKLIQLVSCHEELYDLGNKNYFDAALKNRRWEHIATVLNKKVEECKQRWESLRAQFRKVSRARKNGHIGKKRAKWRYDDEMAFLLPHMNLRRKSRAVSLKVESEAAEVDEEVEYEHDSHDIPLEGLATDDIPEASRMGLLPQGEMSQDPLSSQLLNHILRVKDLKTKPVTITKEKDSVDLFFESIKATVRTFSPGDFYSVKTGIFNLVSEVEKKYVFPESTDGYDGDSNIEVLSDINL